MAATSTCAPGENSGETAAPAVRPQTMRAIVQAKYGSADVLRVEEIDQPTIGDNEVLVRVHAAGLDRGTWHLMAGQAYLMRLMGVAAGADVSRFKVGDEVFGISQGSFAEYACAHEDKLARKPESLRA